MSGASRSQVQPSSVFTPPKSRTPASQDFSPDTPLSRVSVNTPLSPDGSQYTGSQYSIYSPGSPASSVSSLSNPRSQCQAPQHVQRDLSVNALCVTTPMEDHSFHEFDTQDGFDYFSVRRRESLILNPQTPNSLAYIHEHGLPGFSEESGSPGSAQEESNAIIDESTRETIPRAAGPQPPRPPQPAADETVRILPPADDDIETLCISFLKADVRYPPDQIEHLVGKLEDYFNGLPGDSGIMASTLLRSPQLRYIAAALDLESCVLDALRGMTDKAIPAFFSSDLLSLFGPGPDALLNGIHQDIVRQLVDTREDVLVFDVAFLDTHVNAFIGAVEMVRLRLRFLSFCALVPDMAVGAARDAC